MALLPILIYPDPRLKLVAEPVGAFDAALSELCANLLQTMYENEGIGLAATQVNVQQRIFVLDISDKLDQSMCFINPVITHREGSTTHEEGCLSFPDIYAKVKRSTKVTIEYWNLQGQVQTLNATGLLAICIQHEIDHLDGITFFEHLSPLKKKLLRNKLAKLSEKTL